MVDIFKPVWVVLFLYKSAKPKIGGKNRARSKCSFSWYGKNITFKTKKTCSFLYSHSDYKYIKNSNKYNYSVLSPKTRNTKEFLRRSWAMSKKVYPFVANFILQ